MMTSSNGNIFRVTGHLCGEFTGPRWIPRTKASDAELWCFSLICVRINDRVNKLEAGDLIRYRTHYDVIVMNVTHLATVFGSAISPLCPLIFSEVNNIYHGKCIRLPHSQVRYYVVARDLTCGCWFCIDVTQINWHMFVNCLQSTSSCMSCWYIKVISSPVFLSFAIFLCALIFHGYMNRGQVTEMGLSCYMVLLSFDSKTR